MRIVVVADTHKDFNALHTLIKAQREKTDLFLHLGDGEREVADLLALYPGLPLCAVRGNCDVTDALPPQDLVEADGVRIFMCHGDTYHVKYSLNTLEDMARSARARIALYGHTHCQYYAYRHGLHVMNPGSLSFPRGSDAGYGVIEIRQGQVLCNLAKVK